MSIRYKVLALNIHGDITYCTCPPELRGLGNCNHIGHQESGETPEEFLSRMEKEKIEDSSSDKIKKKPFIPYEGTEIKVDLYRMSEEERKNLFKIENRMQLDQNIEGGYIELEEPLWNDMDKNYFSQISRISAKNITKVLHKELYIVLEGSGKLKTGSVIESEEIESYEKLGYPEDWDEDIKIGTGVIAMNEFAKKGYNFEATKHVYVLPYYMRMGVSNNTQEYHGSASEATTIKQKDEDNVISSDLTIGYKYLLRQRANPDRQQLAYDALLNNSALDQNRARYSDGFVNKSLADEFAGKGGVFRAVLSGNSIPYSGRAVIVPNNNLTFGEVAIPPSMAIDIYRPTILRQLINEGKSVEEIDEWMGKFRVPQDKVKEEDRIELDTRIKDLRIAMNRQPSLHQSSFQSFRPRVGSSASAEIHPLYCKAYNADFDGDECSFYGFNNTEINSILDRSIDASLEVNTTLPRHHETVTIMPNKDSLFGLLNILEQRDE